MEKLPSVVPVKTEIQGLLSVSWMPTYDRRHDDLGSPELEAVVLTELPMAVN